MLPIIPLAKNLLRDFSLCDLCLGRIFSKPLKLKSKNNIGKKINKIFKKNGSTNPCFICNNIMSNLTTFSQQVFESTKNYEFNSFSIGIILPHKIIDHDDLIRSRLKFIGTDSIKTVINQEMSRIFTQKTKKSFKKTNSDLIITYNFKNQEIEVKSKALLLFGRYLKKIRGIPQKSLKFKKSSTPPSKQEGSQKDKISSVETILEKYLQEEFSGDSVKFSWVGGEEKESLLVGLGRPFFAKISNPQKRKIKKKNFKHSSGVEVKNLAKIPFFPKNPLKFMTYVEVNITTEQKINSKFLPDLKTLEQKIIHFENETKGNISKNLFHIRYKKKSDYSFILRFGYEGGFPIRNFVSGKKISPNVSSVLNNNCTCINYDINEIQLNPFK